MATSWELVERDMAKVPSMPSDVALVFKEMPSAVQTLLKQARAQLFEMAAGAGVGTLTETLKWGQPAYLTEASKAGSTVRLALHKGQATIFFNCRTTLVEGFRADFPEAFTYVGSRALLLTKTSDPQALGICLARALTYHRDKQGRRASA